MHLDFDVRVRLAGQGARLREAALVYQLVVRAGRLPARPVPDYALRLP